MRLELKYMFEISGRTYKYLFLFWRAIYCKLTAC